THLFFGATPPPSPTLFPYTTLFRSLCSPPLAQCSINTTTRLTPATRSIAPPMPLTSLPGIIQLARSPCSDTCMAPSNARLIWPRSEEHTSELQSLTNLVCRLLLEKK